MRKLKPCPFCGNDVQLKDKEFEDFSGNYFTNSFSIIECELCGIKMTEYPKKGYGTTEEQKQKLSERWNKRKDDE